MSLVRLLDPKFLFERAADRRNFKSAARAPTCGKRPAAVPPKRKFGNRPALGPVVAVRVNLMIWRLFRTHSQDRSIDELYGAIVAQARAPAFYRDYRVPDTVAGRFDLIVLHLILLIERLGRDADTGRNIGQRLFDVFCRDLDDNLREMGVGDLAVPKRMRGFGEAFYGRQAAYLAAFASSDARELENTLRRNIFAEADAGTTARGARRLARYVHAARRRLEDQEDGALLRGEVSFPQPETVAEAMDHVESEYR